MHSRYIVIGFISWIGATLFLKSQLNHRTYSCAKIIRNPFFGLSWLENHTWLVECLTLFSLTHRKKRSCATNSFFNILNAWSKDIWKKSIHIFKLNIKWYSTCTEIGVNSPKILIHFYIMYIHKWWALSHNKCLWTHLLSEFPIAKNLRNYIPTPEFSRHTTVHQHAHFTSSLSLIPTHNKHIENHLTQDD